jgi:hypothetical protein
MKIYLAAVAVSLALAPVALAQMVPNGQNGPSVQPKAPTPDFAPPALPGAGDAPGIATAPKVKKADQGDPTTELFTAINNNDYNSAQDAISRGADLGAQNALGETPLDLSIALNRNSLTFLLLGARNEAGGGTQAPPVAAAPAPVTYAARPQPVSVESAPVAHSAPAPVMGNNPGTPNASVGFLGFGPKN